MTMLDDDRLASLLARAGAAFEVPASGADDILARAAGAARADGGAAAEAAGAADAEDAPDWAEAGLPARDTTAGCAASAPPPAGTASSRRRPASSSRSWSPARWARWCAVRQARPSPRAWLGPAGWRPPRAADHDRPARLGGPGRHPAQRRGADALRRERRTGTAQASGSTPTVTTPTAPSLPSGSVGQSAKIEQTGTLGLSVGRGDLGPTMTRLTTLAGANGGFVANSQTQSGAAAGGAPYGSITLQVPVDSFSTVLKQAQALGKTTDLTTKATDVTGQYVDLQARIAALEASRQQYLTIMAKATTVGDVLAVQEQLDSIQSQIEQLQGQLQVLTSETSYSTLTVTVNEGTPPARPEPVARVGARPGVARQHRRVRRRRRRA